jgi:hypothetical protein
MRFALSFGVLVGGVMVAIGLGFLVMGLRI